jgi:Ca2+-transporting ATPase
MAQHGPVPDDPPEPGGLRGAEAARRLARDGPNELPAERVRRFWPVLLEVLREPMLLLLVAAGTLYLMLGEPADALMLLGFVFVVIGITVVQERRTERALSALRQLSSPRALVLRDGVPRRIPGREVVEGDVVIVAEGDRVPADALLRRASQLAVDESLLTGESVPVAKRPSLDASRMDQPGGDGLPSLFSGSLVTSGHGVCEVLRTGTRTEVGRIGTAIQSITSETTPLQAETRRIVRRLAAVGGVACAIVVVVYALTRGGDWLAWKQGGLAGIAMAMAILPEEFPVVLTVFLALGAWRISRSHVLTRRMPAIETLGAATVLCVDKTGTLTLNQMSVTALEPAEGGAECPPLSAALSTASRELLRLAALASRADPVDPMDRAAHEAAATAGLDLPGLGARCVREYPLTPEFPATTYAWRLEGREAVLLASKGAPEAIGRLCRLPDAEAAALLVRVDALAARGWRVLAVAQLEVSPAACPAHPLDLVFHLAGLVAFADPLRPEVPATVAQCHEAGIRVAMITGDYPATARQIAAQAGIRDPSRVLTGQQLEQVPDAELVECIRGTHVFARMAPQQKLRLVRALKEAGEVVAMTGDGVNDGPALKAAHIGIAMGGRGTDVARECASLVLLNDDFPSIVAAIRLGRRIYDNIRKAIAFILAVHVPIAGLSMIPVFFPSWPLLLLPVHIVFLELIIDPACSLVFEAEAEEEDVMRRPPRGRSERLFSRATVLVALLQGLSVLVACSAIVVLASRAHSPDEARAMSFAALVLSIIVVILINRSWSRSTMSMLREPNRALWWVVGGTAVFLGLALFTPAGRAVFSFAALDAGDLGLSLLAGLACLAWFELLKRSRWWRFRINGGRAR